MESPHEKKFIPKGAFAFFGVLVILALIFWYSIYLLMIDRT
ncbi:MAG TPA: cytochrome c oxidase subunit 2A [Chitinophagaceae bacterium]